MLSRHSEDHTGGNFHLTSLTSVVCIDDPAVGPGVPKAGFDTTQVVGIGRWDGVDGYIVEATIVDGGEPGAKDAVSIVIKAPGGTVVSSLSGRLSGGNQQAHK